MTVFEVAPGAPRRPKKKVSRIRIGKKVTATRILLNRRRVRFAWPELFSLVSLIWL